MRHEIMEPAGDESIDLFCQHSERLRPFPFERENLVHKTKITILEEDDTGFHIGMQVRLIEERIVPPDQVSPI